MLAIAVGGDFHLMLEVFQNLQVEQQGNDPFINDICYSSGIKRPVGVFSSVAVNMNLVHFVNSASFCCLHLTCVHHRAFLIPMSHVSKADVVGDEAVLFCYQNSARQGYRFSQPRRPNFFDLYISK